VAQAQVKPVGAAVVLELREEQVTYKVRVVMVGSG
jgi:hypothetical protein